MVRILHGRFSFACQRKFMFRAYDADSRKICWAVSTNWLATGTWGSDGENKREVVEESEPQVRDLSE